MKGKELKTSDHVVYVDQVGRRHEALVTIVWENNPHYSPSTPAPGCNLVFVSGDESKDDPYGRQIERETSVVHKTNQPAHGNYWLWPDEVQ